MKAAFTMPAPCGATRTVVLAATASCSAKGRLWNASRETVASRRCARSAAMMLCSCTSLRGGGRTRTVMQIRVLQRQPSFRVGASCMQAHSMRRRKALLAAVSANHSSGSVVAWPMFGTSSRKLPTIPAAAGSHAERSRSGAWRPRAASLAQALLACASQPSCSSSVLPQRPPSGPHCAAQKSTCPAWPTLPQTTLGTSRSGSATCLCCNLVRFDTGRSAHLRLLS